MNENYEKKRSYHKSLKTIDNPDKKLSEMQERFVIEYLKDLNASKAYKRAGYKSDKKTVAQAVSALFHKPYIQQAIQRAKEERSARTMVSVDRVLTELAKLGYSNIQDYFDRWGADGLYLKDSNQLTLEQTACIEAIETVDTQFGVKLKFKLYSKLQALQMLGEHLGMWGKKEKESDDPRELARRMQQAYSA